MKTILYLTLPIFIMLCFVPNSFAQNTDLESVVRVIYFIPKDRNPDPDINARLDSKIKDVQQFYADQMESHGFGRKTFRLETNPTGQVVIHHVNGKFNERYYYNETGTSVFSTKVFEEIDIGTIHDIYVVMMDISLNFGGFVASSVVFNSTASADSRFVIAHELGHTFGLGHDFRTNHYVMSYTGWKPSLQLSYCAAEWLDVHRYFNAGQGQSNLPNASTTIQMLPATASPPNAIRLRFEVTDADGLHQAQLVTPLGGFITDIRNNKSLTDCKRLNGEKTTTIEFVTTELMNRYPNSFVELGVIDKHGNTSYKSFDIEVASLLPPNKVVSIPDAKLAAVIRSTLGLSPGDDITQADMRRLQNLDASGHEIKTLTGIEHAVGLRELNLSSNQISDITPLKGLTNLVQCLLGNNQISDIIPLIGLIKLTFLDLSINQISDITPLIGLTNLNSLYLGHNEISDITSLTKLTQLTRLKLGGLQIKDTTTLTKLTQLKHLSLAQNQISDIMPLAKLTHLQDLVLVGNRISDITPLRKMTQLESLQLSFNEISDVTPLESLVNLKYLYLPGNPIKDKEPLFDLLQKNPDIEIYLKFGGEPLPVTLSSFRAEYTDADVILKWTTESEVDNAGFYLLRSETKNGEFKVINPTLIQGAGTTSERHTYTWTDTTAKPNIAYYYRIQDISHAGVRKDLATVRMRGFISASGKLTTTWAGLKTHER